MNKLSIVSSGQISSRIESINQSGNLLKKF